MMRPQPIYSNELPMLPQKLGIYIPATEISFCNLALSDSSGCDVQISSAWDLKNLGLQKLKAKVHRRMVNVFMADKLMVL